MRHLSLPFSLALAPVIVAALGCGGSTKPATEEPDPPAADAGAVADSGATPATSEPLTVAECTGFFEHLLAVGIEEMRATKPADEIPTEEQVSAIKTKMIAEDMDGCRAQPRALLECALAAPSTAAIQACDSER